MDAIEYRRLFSDLPVAWVVHASGVVHHFNRAAADLFGIQDVHAPVGRPLLDYVHPEWRAAVLERWRQLGESGRPVQAAAARMLCPDGRELWVETIASSTVLEGRPAVQVLCWDVTARVLEQQRLAQAALHDPLTGLANRALLEARWGELLQGWTEPSRPPVALFCDLDGFKRINDTYGHAAGDATLQVIADRLRHALRPGDVAGRLGGDEFVVLLQSGDLAAGRALGERLPGLLQAPIRLAEGVVTVGVSMGVAVPAPGEEIGALLKRADEAMYQAKRAAAQLAPVTAP